MAEARMSPLEPKAPPSKCDHEARQRQAVKDRIINAFQEGTIPVAESTLNDITNLFITDAIEVLRLHPGYLLESKFRSLKTTLTLFERAAGDLLAALDRFCVFSRTPEFHYISHAAMQADVETAVRKEIFAFTELAHSLQDHCRRITTKDWKPTEFEDMLADHFGNKALHDFICGLRTALHHRSMVEAEWLILGSGIEATSHYTFQTVELRLIQEWKSTALAFMDQAGDEIDVRSMTEDYRTRVRAFYNWFLDAFEGSAPPEVLDYRRCWDEHTRRSSRGIYRLLLNEFLRRGVDPYPHLHKYLRPDQLAQALTLPNHSQQQVDLIIEMVDRARACDSDLRAIIYRLFGVT